MSFPDRLLVDGEEPVIVVRQHLKVLALPCVVALSVCGLAGLLVSRIGPGEGQLPLRVVIIGAALLAVLRWSMWPFVVWRTTVYALTTWRLLIRQGVLRRTIRDVPLDRIDDAGTLRTPTDRIFGSGALSVETGGDEGPLVLESVPRVDEVHRTLWELLDEVDQPEQPAPALLAIEADLDPDLDPDDAPRLLGG